MFNGIVKSIGSVESVTSQEGGVLTTIRTSLKRSFKKGESVLVDGICSTVVSSHSNTLTFFYMEETLKKTNVKSYVRGTRVNIEPSLRLGEDLSGHVISGHVDGVGTIHSIQEKGKMSIFTITLSKNLIRYIVQKGSVAIDGISLTVVSCTPSRFSVALIPFTLEHTTLGLKKIGEYVNIETDMIAKYVEKLYGVGDSNHFI